MEATATNSNGEQGKILKDVSGAAPAAKPVKKKNLQVQVTFLDKDGNAGAQGEDIVALRIETKTRNEVLRLADLSKPMLLTAAAFGLNTTLRNAHNSAVNAGGDGNAALFNRIANIKAGEWRASGDGTDDGIPLVIEAMIKAKKDKNAYTDGMEEAWLTEYRGLDKAGKAAWTKVYSEKTPIKIALLQIKAERAAAKANEAAGKVAEDGEDF